jgi:Asp-tRNA(Asn)/Glu-tRNA(Gln) amidotransferase A subunit family amidase
LEDFGNSPISALKVSLPLLTLQDPPMRFLIAFDPEHLRQQAAASTQRYAAGQPLSPLDGVPFAVKDCTDAAPYPTTAGTAFMAQW